MTTHKWSKAKNVFQLPAKDELPQLLSDISLPQVLSDICSLLCMGTSPLWHLLTPVSCCFLAFFNPKLSELQEAAACVTTEESFLLFSCSSSFPLPPSPCVNVCVCIIAGRAETHCRYVVPDPCLNEFPIASVLALVVLVVQVCVCMSASQQAELIHIVCTLCQLPV